MLGIDIAYTANLLCLSGISSESFFAEIVLIKYGKVRSHNFAQDPHEAER
jgi:hypothetical protein